VFNDFPLWGNAAVFAASAATVWFAGTRLARTADAIAEKTGIGREFLGVLLLGGVTSSPELAVATTAALSGVPALSVNDLLGSAAFNVVIIALADAALGRDAITSVLGSPGVLLQGVLGIVLLALVVAAAAAGDVAILGVGAWVWLMLAFYLASIWLISHSKGLQAWIPAGQAAARPRQNHRRPAASLRRLIASTAAAGAAILVAGFLLAKTADALAAQTGLGTNFFGVAFLAVSTSLPEVSTVLAAVRLGRYEMAIADVFGTNLFNVAILFVVDALYAGPPVLAEVGRFAGFAALLALVLTALFLAGMIERRDRTVLRMGIDSLAALAVYLGGLAVLYQLR
jgi:cation:H+ antiporter